MKNFNNTPFPWHCLFLLTAGHFLSDFYANFLPPLLPGLSQHLGLSLSTIGTLMMVYSFASSVLQPLCGYLIDRFGWTWLLLVTLVINALCVSFLPLLPSTALLFASVIGAGLANCLFHPVSSSLVHRLVPVERRGFATSLFIAGGNIGYALAPLSLTAILLQWGTTSLPWSILPGLVLSLLFWQARLHEVPLARTAPTGAPDRWYANKTVLRLNAAMGLRSWAQVAILTFLPLLMRNEGHSPLLAGTFLTLFLMGGTIGGIVGGFTGDRIGHKRWTLWALGSSVFLVATFLLCQGNLYLSACLLILAGAAMQGTVPSSVVWAQKLLPGNAALAAGMMLGLSFGLGGIGAAITGALADKIGIIDALWCTLLPLGLAFPLTYATREPD